jgi:hypothetical protein
MKTNNIKIKIAENAELSLAQHFDENGGMVCCEVAVIDHRGVNDPLPFSPDIDGFTKVISAALRFHSNSFIAETAPKRKPG